MILYLRIANTLSDNFVEYHLTLTVVLLRLLQPVDCNYQNKQFLLLTWLNF